MRNSTSGNHIYQWSVETGSKILVPNKATSRRSDTIIDFGITNSKEGWTIEVREDGTSDHRPVLFQSPYGIDNMNYFRKTSWNVFHFVLCLLYEYWNTLVYELEINHFFELFSDFLSALWDRCSECKEIGKYRTLWPPYLVELAKQVNRERRKYRRYKTTARLECFLRIKTTFINERNNFIQERRAEQLSWIQKDFNIWKYVKPIFHTHSPPFRGLTLSNNCSETNPAKIVEQLADHFERHFSSPEYDESNL